METTDNKKIILALRIYSVLILLYAVFEILAAILPGFRVIAAEWNRDPIHYFFIFAGISLYTTPINLVVGYGLLRRRFWARYGAIAVMLTFPVHVLTQFLWWGVPGFKNVPTLIQFFFVILTLLLFSRRPVKALFGNRSFRFISWHGLFVVLIVLISFSWIIFSFYWKVRAAWKFGYPFFTERPPVIALEKPGSSGGPDRYRKVQLLNVSVWMPKEFSIGRLSRTKGKSQSWVVRLQNQGVNTKAYLTFGNDFIYDDLFTHETFWKILGSGSKFDLEKYILTNNWNPRLMVIRPLIKPKGEAVETKEIYGNGLRGFLKEWQQGEAFFREFSVYDDGGTQTISGTILSVQGYLDEKDVLTILSSVEFIKPEDSSRSGIHYDNGLKFYKQGDVLQAQVEFANAYVLSSENPDTVFMFAKSLLLNDPKDYNHVKSLLDRVLKLKPDHKDAQKLLKEIESKLPTEPRKWSDCVSVQ